MSHQGHSMDCLPPVMEPEKTRSIPKGFIELHQHKEQAHEGYVNIYLLPVGSIVVVKHPHKGICSIHSINDENVMLKVEESYEEVLDLIEKAVEKQGIL